MEKHVEIRISRKRIIIFLIIIVIFPIICTWGIFRDISNISNQAVLLQSRVTKLPSLIGKEPSSQSTSPAKDEDIDANILRLNTEIQNMKESLASESFYGYNLEDKNNFSEFDRRLNRLELAIGRVLIRLQAVENATAKYTSSSAPASTK